MLLSPALYTSRAVQTFPGPRYVNLARRFPEDEVRCPELVFSEEGHYS